MSQASRPLIPANAQNHYEVAPEDLPLSCPMPEMYLWNSHPRVYLPIEATGWAKCPYCGAEYSLRSVQSGPAESADYVPLGDGSDPGAP